MPNTYTTLAQVYAKLPSNFVLEALDDDRDGELDSSVWDAVAEGAAREVDGLLAMRYPTPFAGDLPAVVVNASLYFVLETLYERRGHTGENNPYQKRADDERKNLRDIGAGKLPLTPSTVKKTPSVSAVTEPARTSSASGNLST